MKRARGILCGAVLLLASGALAQSLPETDYVLQCRGCHGPEGAGVPGLVPGLEGMTALLATESGRARLLQVPGVRQASLSDERLAALLNWAAVHFAREGGLPHRAIDADEVARLRAQRGTSQRLR